MFAKCSAGFRQAQLVVFGILTFMIPKRAKTFGNKATRMYPFWIELSVEHLAQVLVAAVATAGWVTNWLMGMR